jgi:hypothetical protein
LGIKNRSAFTIVEIMVTSAFLSFAMVAIFHSFFSSLNALRYISNRLNVSLEVSNNIWLIQDSMQRLGSLCDITGKRPEAAGGLSYTCALNPRFLNDAYGFNEITVICTWLDKGREFSISRSAYVNKM